MCSQPQGAPCSPDCPCASDGAQAAVCAGDRPWSAEAKPAAWVPSGCLEEHQRGLDAKGLQHQSHLGASETACNPLPCRI